MKSDKPRNKPIIQIVDDDLSLRLSIQSALKTGGLPVENSDLTLQHTLRRLLAALKLSSTTKNAEDNFKAAKRENYFSPIHHLEGGGKL